MEKKKNVTQYHLTKILKKTDTVVTYLANENFMSFKKLIYQIDLSKITQNELNEYKSEIKINSLFNTRFILKIEDYNMNNKQLNVINEYFEGGENLKKFLLNEQKKDRKFLKEEIIWKIFIQLCLALYHVHNKNIIHRNINPTNILIDSKYNIKLTNFKKSFSLKNSSEFCNDFDININGDLSYTSPEILLKQNYNTKSDVWSLGVVLYEMCTFNKPFQGESVKEIYNKIIENIYPSVGNKYSKELINLLGELIQKNFNERPSIKDIIHKYVFISRSKENNLYDYLDKIINPQKKRVFSSKIDKKRRPITAVQNKRNVKKSANYQRNKENEDNYINKKKEIDMDLLTNKFFDVKNKVKNMIGENNANDLFKELNDVNINDMINKYYINRDIKNININNINNTENGIKKDEDNDKENKIQKANELKKYVEEYINILNEVLAYKNKA
jgi:serine/threonine protein kinase